MVMPMFAETMSVDPDSFKVRGEDLVDYSKFSYNVSAKYRVKHTEFRAMYRLQGTYRVQSSDLSTEDK